jgi:LysR family transcriptional regulator (chromosome initiation inhibitor)
VQALGVMRYLPMATAAYTLKYLPEGFVAEAVATAPSLAWNREDALQDMLVRKVFRRNVSGPKHFVPTAVGFGAAVRAGLGWGMFAEQLVADEVAAGTLKRVSDAYLDVPLFWQCWKLDSPTVDAITSAVRAAASTLRGATA